MVIWSSEIKELERLNASLTGHFPELERELSHLVSSDDPNVLMLYSRRCLEVIITDLCEKELKRPRKTYPLKGIIDKLNKEEKVPSHIITSMHGLNDLSTYGAHPKDFDTEQVKPTLSNLAIIIKWFVKYRGLQIPDSIASDQEHYPAKQTNPPGASRRERNKIALIASAFVLFISVIVLLGLLNIIELGNKGAFVSNLEKSIAVLPFTNLSGNPDQEYFSDGMMDEILDRLFKIGDLKVISRTSSMRYKNSELSLKEIAGELGVSAILEGSVRRAGNIVRITVQLIDARNDTHLWSETYDGDLSDLSKIFAMQSKVAQSVARELKAVIAPEEKQLIDKIPTENPEAYKAIQKGQYFLNKFTDEALDSALQYFELAKEIDPDYVLAYYGIAGVWSFRQQSGLVSPAEGNQKSMDALMKAYAIDSNNAVVQGGLAVKKVWGTYDWEGGESGFKKSISLNPNDAGSHAAYSHLLNILGRPDEALEQIDIAIRLDPVNPFITTFYAVDLFMARKYEESIKAHNKALNLEPGYPFTLSNLWQPYYMVGRTEEAYETLKSLWSMDPESLKSLEQGYLKDGIRGAVLSLADRLDEIWTNNPQQFFCPSVIAMYYSAGQETDKAIYWLEQAYKIRDPNLPYLLMPVYDNVRNDPRFIEIARKMNLPNK